MTNALFGYDFFIAYSWRDGAEYARSLDVALSEDFSVHFDARDYHAGNDLDLLTRVRVRNSRNLVIVATPAALNESVWVKKEADQFLASKRIPLIVDVDGAVAAALRAPNVDKLSGWIHGARKNQGGGVFIDPILRLIDNSGHRANGARIASQEVIDKLRASFTGARVAQRRLRVVLSVAIMLFFLLSATIWLATAAYEQLVAAVKSRSENAAVAAISLADQGFMPAALLMARRALPDSSRWVQAYDPRSISAAIEVFNGLSIGTSRKMVFHIQDADFDASGSVLATIETDFTGGASNFLPRWGRLWSVQTGALMGQVRLPKESSFRVAVLSDHRSAIYGGLSGKLMLWNFNSSAVEPFVTNENISAISEIVSSDYLDRFGVASSNGIHVFDVRSRRSIGHAFSEYNAGKFGKPLQSFDLHPGGALLAAKTATGAVIFDYLRNDTRCRIPQGDATFVSMRFSPDGKRLGLISKDGSTFTVDLDESGSCSGLQRQPIRAANGEFLCGRFSADWENTAFVDHEPWILRITREPYHSENIYCAYLFDWRHGKTLSTVLLMRGTTNVAQTFLGADDLYPDQRDRSYLHQLGISMVTKNLDMFSYREGWPGGVFIRRRWFRLDPKGITLAKGVPSETLTFLQRVASDPTAQSWDCRGYDAGPYTETVALSRSGRFAVVADPLSVQMYDRETCTRVSNWPISMVRTVDFGENDSALFVMNAQRQVFRLRLPTSLFNKDLASRLKGALSELN